MLVKPLSVGFHPAFRGTTVGLPLRGTEQPFSQAGEKYGPEGLHQLAGYSEPRRGVPNLATGVTRGNRDVSVSLNFPCDDGHSFSPFVEEDGTAGY